MSSGEAVTNATSRQRVRCRRRTWLGPLISLLLVVTALPVGAAESEPVWTRQFGSTGSEEAHAVAVAATGTIYVVGSTGGTLPNGGGSAGSTDAYLLAYGPNGVILWVRQFGTTGIDQARSVAVDPDGTIYVAGWTAGALPGGGGSASNDDAYVRAYDPKGVVLWTRQFGSSGIDRAHGVKVGPDGTIYVAGSTTGTLPDADGAASGVDAFVRSYDSDGAVIWTRQFGTSSADDAAFASAVAVSGDGTVYVVGQSDGSLPGGAWWGNSDAFVRSYDPDGTVKWTRQFGTASYDAAIAVGVSGDGAIVVTGETEGTLAGGGNLGSGDAFVRVYDPDGDVVWTHQFGSTSFEGARAVGVAPDGTIYAAGHTFGALPDGGGQIGGIDADAFVRAFGSDGGVEWTRQFGTMESDIARGVAVGADGAVYVTGYTSGTLPDGGGSAGGQDAFLMFYAKPSPTVGLVDPTQGQWHLRNSTGAVTSFYFGNPGDYPIMGDWNCNGIDTPGMYRQSDGYVYLRNTNTQGIANIRFFFGNPGDIPIAGDFNNNGCDTVSIYRPSNQTFYIINALGANDGGLGAADFSYVFGNPGDKPFVGDFNGNGTDTVGLHREATGFVYFRNTHTQGNADNQFFFGDPNDRFITGDWNNNGTDTPGIFRPSNTTFYFRFTNTQGNADAQFTWGQSGWLPVSGNFGLG